MKTEEQTNLKATLIDLVLVLVTLFTLKHLLLQLPEFWTFAGPISLLASLGVATWRLKKNNESWKSIGFIQDQTKIKLALWTVVALVTTILLGNIAAQLVTPLFASNPATNEISQVMAGRFANLPGNLTVYLYWLIVAWIIGGFTEELLFRGFLINRIEKLFYRVPFAIGIAVLFQALIFGQQHFYYQGLVGFVSTGVIGLASGLIYVYCKRRLWPLILSHGLANTLGMTILFFNG